MRSGACIGKKRAAVESDMGVGYWFSLGRLGGLAERVVSHDEQDRIQQRSQSTGIGLSPKLLTLLCKYYCCY